MVCNPVLISFTKVGMTYFPFRPRQKIVTFMAIVTSVNFNKPK